MAPPKPTQRRVQKNGRIFARSFWEQVDFPFSTHHSRLALPNQRSGASRPNIWDGGRGGRRGAGQLVGPAHRGLGEERPFARRQVPLPRWFIARRLRNGRAQLPQSGGVIQGCLFFIFWILEKWEIQRALSSIFVFGACKSGSSSRVSYISFWDSLKVSVSGTKSKMQLLKGNSSNPCHPYLHTENCVIYFHTGSIFMKHYTPLTGRCADSFIVILVKAS